MFKKHITGVQFIRYFMLIGMYKYNIQKEILIFVPLMKDRSKCRYVEK